MERFTVKPVISFGSGALAALEELSGQRILLVTDEFLSRRSGLMDGVKGHLKGCEIRVFDAVKPDPSVDLVARGVRELEEFRPDALVAFGGGSPMDCAKAMRHFSSVPTLPFWCVPTTAGTGSEVTSFAVLTDSAKGVKYPLVDDALLPDRAVLDPALLASVPPAVTADTGMDVLTHAAEAYVAKGATPFTDALAEKAFSTAFRALPAACRGDLAAREEMLLSSCMAGMAFNAAGLGLSHGLAHALGGRFHVSHGRLNAVVLPAVMAFNASSGPTAGKYARLAWLCGLAKSPRALISALHRLRMGLGLPERLTACGVEEGALREGLEEVAAAALSDRCTPSNPRSAGAEELKAMLKELM